MSITQLLILLGAALIIWLVGGFKRTTAARLPLMLAFSVIAIYWLQPALPIRGLDFWLPTATLFIVLISWGITAQPEERSLRRNRRPLLIVIGVVLALALTRLVSVQAIITPSRPPQLWQVIIAIVLLGVFSLVFVRVRKNSKTVLLIGIITVLVFFVLLKLPALTVLVSGILRSFTGQTAVAASALDIRWLGFSYVAFRLIHTLRERQNGRLPGVTLEEYFIFILFFPAFTAGPIDRIERFIIDLQTESSHDAVKFGQAFQRLFLGVVKKFILADLLAMISLNGTNAAQIQSTGWAWILLYAYSFQIFFDFSGYTDIAIGLAGMMGVRLPENFNRPYLQQNLTLFWNNWHMSLTQWFRAYFFNPLTRKLRSAKKPIRMEWVLFITQTATFTLIGLWHGITLNFIAWGLWHGIGLFIQNRYSTLSKPFAGWLEEHPKIKPVSRVVSTLLTFHYIALGWVWFALPSLSASAGIFTRLFEAGS